MMASIEKVPKNDRKLNIESADRVKHNKISVQRIATNRKFNFSNIGVVTNMYPMATIMMKLGKYTPKKKSVASYWLMFVRIEKKGGLNRAYAPPAIPMKTPKRTA